MGYVEREFHCVMFHFIHTSRFALFAYLTRIKWNSNAIISSQLLESRHAWNYINRQYVGYKVLIVEKLMATRWNRRNNLPMTSKRMWAFLIFKLVGSCLWTLKFPKFGNTEVSKAVRILITFQICVELVVLCRHRPFPPIFF